MNKQESPSDTFKIMKNEAKNQERKCQYYIN